MKDKNKDKTAEKPDKKAKVPVNLRNDKDTQFTDSGGAQKKG